MQKKLRYTKKEKNTTNKCTKQTQMCRSVPSPAHVPSHSCLKFTTYLLKLVTVERGKDIIGRKKVKVVN